MAADKSRHSKPSARRDRRVRSGRRREAARRQRPGRIRRAGTRVAGHLSPRAADALGVGLIVLTALWIMGLWLGTGGPFGHAMRVSIRSLFGPAGYALPAVAGYWAFLFLGGTGRDDRGRMLVGLVVGGLGIFGITSLARGNPSPGAGYHVVAGSGGFIGALIAWPLSRVLSAYGAVVVCLGLAALGVLVFTATPITAVGRGARRLFLGPQVERAGRSSEAAPERRGDRGVRVERDEGDDLLPIAPSMPSPDEALIVAEVKQVRLPLTSHGNAYRLPPVDLLRLAPASKGDARDAEHTKAALERTFQNFGVAARVVSAHRGPTVTMYEVEVEAGTKVNRVLSLQDDIAYALATPDVRIVAPIPGKSAIGVEVPNKVRDFVMLGDILSSKAAREATKPLSVGLGKDVHGRSVMVNLAEMPHVLIAGATGAGKSSLINTFVTSILMRTSPDDAKLVLVDPKRVELSHFADLPHLLSPVIVHPKRAAEALAWVVREMEMRYEALATVGMRDIEMYNQAQIEGTLRIPPGQEAGFGRIPYILVVIDELADLIMVAPRDAEDAICRLAQMARAVGIHLVVATQRPSVDVVTGLIKANIPSRIAFMTASQADSRVILDVGGAEKLVGHGDMLFQPANVSKAVRIQGAWVTQGEIEAVAQWCRKQREPEYLATIEGLTRPATAGGDDDLTGDDALLEQAAELVIRS